MPTSRSAHTLRVKFSVFQTVLLKKFIFCKGKNPFIQSLKVLCANKYYGGRKIQVYLNRMIILEISTVRIFITAPPLRSFPMLSFYSSPEKFTIYSPRTERKLQFKTARPEIFHLFIECAEKQSDVRVKFFQTFRFLFGLAVAYTEKRDYRRNVHNRKCFGVFVSDSSHRDKPLEDARMIINHSVYISFCVKLRKFGIAELLYRHHSAKSRNRFNGITFFPQEPPYLLTIPIYWEIKLY